VYLRFIEFYIIAGYKQAALSKNSVVPDYNVPFIVKPAGLF